VSAGGDLRVRDARGEDRDAVRALTLAAYGEYATVMAPPAWRGFDRAVRAALDTSEEVERIVAERDGGIVGSVVLYRPAADAYGGMLERLRWPELRLLAVSPAERGRGVGRALVEECVRRARRMGATELGLHTSRSMRAAIHLYEEMGFERAPEHDFQPEGAERVTAYRLRLDGDR
jgi:GNAT superfamily N-acetyltransferase